MKKHEAQWLISFFKDNPNDFSLKEYNDKSSSFKKWNKKLKKVEIEDKFLSQWINTSKSYAQFKDMLAYKLPLQKRIKERICFFLKEIKRALTINKKNGI